MRLTHVALGAALATALTLATTGCSSGNDGHDHSAHDHGSHESGKKRSGDGHEGHDHGGAKPRPSTPAAGAVALTKAEPSANYPLTTCVVSGDDLDAMDERLAFKYGDEEVQFCCEGCIDEFKEDPEAFMKKVRAAKAR